MSQQQQLHVGTANVTLHEVGVFHGEGLSGKDLPSACDSSTVQELEPECPAAGTCTMSSVGSVDRRVNLFQYVQVLLEEGLLEKALSLSCKCYHDPDLGKDLMFLEMALILFTNMEKLDMMWAEVKQLDSMQQLYPVAKILGQYYLPAALLTAEMLLCKEWCERTVSLSDLQKVTTLWVTFLHAQCCHDNEAFMAKVLQVGKLIVHEPTYILDLVKSIHAEVGGQSLVICVNLCLMALQEPPQDPHGNPVSASHIDTHNVSLCRFLSELLAEDTGLQRLCLLTSFTITPTKELLAEVDRVYKSVAVRIPEVPLLPSCLNCVLVHGMYSLLPDIISPLVEWRELRVKCLAYLRDSSVLNVQVKLPSPEMTLKVYVKKSALDDDDDEGEGEGAELQRQKATEGSSGPQEDLPRLRTASEQRWLSTMMSLDMSWRPHWLTPSATDNQPAVPGPKECRTQSQESSKLNVGSDVSPPDQDKLPQCSVVLCNFRETLLGHFHLLDNRVKDDQSHLSVDEESPGAVLTALQEDHAYSLPPADQCTQTKEELCITQEMNNTEIPSRKNALHVAEGSCDDDQYQHSMVTRGLNSMQLADGVLVEEGSQDSERSRLDAVLHGTDHEPLDPTTQRCLDSLTSELSCLEEQGNLGKSPEREGRLTEGGTNFEVHQNFLADDMIDPQLPVLNQAINGAISTEEEPPSELTVDINRWFQNVKQPSEASSIVGSDVTPDPVTEEGMQWSAIKSISREGNPNLYELGWNELSLWFSEDEDNNMTTVPKPAVSSDTETSLLALRDPNTLEIRNHESGRGICSLESTISRLRANLCVVDNEPFRDQWEDSQEVTSSSPPPSTPPTPPGKYSTQLLTQGYVFSQQSYHQQSTDAHLPKCYQNQTSVHSSERPGFNQQSFARSETTSKLTTGSPKLIESLTPDNITFNQLSFNQLSAANYLSSVNSTDQQDCNKPSGNPVPVTEQVIGLGSSNKSPIGKPGEKANLGTIQASSHCFNVKHNDLTCGEEALMSDTTATDGLQQPSSNPEAVLYPDHSRSVKETNRNPESVDVSQHRSEVERDLFIDESPARSSPCNSVWSCIMTEIKEERIVDQTCEKKPGLEYKNTALSLVNNSKPTRTKPDLKETPLQNESRTRLLDSLLSFAVQEYRQITGMSTEAESTRYKDAEETTLERRLANGDHNSSGDGGAASGSENPDVTTQVTPADLLSGGELSPKHKPDQVITYQNGQCAVEDVKPCATGASRRHSCRHNGIPDSTDDVQITVERNVNYDSPLLLQSESHASSDKIKELQSDSDCSDFEVVQDVSFRWSVGGKRKTSEPYSWPQKKGSGHQQESRSQEKSESHSRQLSDNKADLFEKQDTVNSSTLPLKEDICHLKEPDSLSVTEKTQVLKDSRKSAKNKTGSARKVKEWASPPGHGYNLRAADHSVNYLVASSSTDLSSEASGEERGTQTGYSLRSTAASSNNATSSAFGTQKKPPRAFSAVQTRCRAQQRQQRSNCSCCSAPGRKAGRLARPKRGSLNAASKDVSDLNNNCSSGSAAGVSDHHASASSSTKDKKLLSIHPKVAPPTQTPGMHGTLTAVKNPQLPWETKAPMRTYSSKRKRSSTC